jgi:hypothetical protein
MRRRARSAGPGEQASAGRTASRRAGRAGRPALVVLLAVCALLSTMAGVGRASGVTVSDLNNGATAASVAETLVGGGVSVSNVVLRGSNRAAGTFSGGAGSIGFDTGIVLSSGKVQTYPEDEPCSRGVEGPNTCYEATEGKEQGPGGSDNITNFEMPGDEELTSLAGFPTFDAAVLEFDFVPAHATAQFSYVFSSEEYSNYANTPYNDVFAFLVNGSNCALVPGTTEPVSVDRINNGNDWEGGETTPHHPELFRDNVRPTPTINSQMDGLTTMLTCTANVTPGQTNHMKLAIADASDPILDSAVFIAGKSLVSGTQISTTLTGGGHSGEKITVRSGTAVTDHGILTGPGSPSATGTVEYKVYSDSKCTQLVASAGKVSISGGTAPPSSAKKFGLGTYYWQATYSGDANNNAATGECGAEVETVSTVEEEEPEGEADPTTMLTSLSGGGQSGEVISVPEGTPVSDTATLRGSNAAEATGTVSYAVYSDSACTQLVAAAGSVSVTAGVVGASAPQTLAAGTYYWQSAYGGDAGNLPSKSACGVEIETVAGTGGGGCSKVTGAATFGSGATEQRVADELSTSLGGSATLTFSWNGGAQRLSLTSLTSAKCVVTKSSRTISGKGVGQVNGAGTYYVTFSLARTSKGVQTLKIKITTKKPSSTLANFNDKPLAGSTEVIS